jgi:hypothetical protein
VRTLWLSRIAAVGAFFTQFEPREIADRVVDALPMALLGPQAEVVVAGLPVGQVMRHQPPRSTGADDVKDAVEDLTAGVLARTPAQAGGAIGQQRPKNFPFRVGEAAGILAHRELLQYRNGLVQIKIRPQLIFQTASQTASSVSGSALPAPPNLEDLRKFFADDSGSQHSGTALSLRPEKMPEIFAGLADLPQMMRDVRGYSQVKAARDEILGKPLTNLATGMVATVSGGSLHKRLSSSAVLRSISPQAHMMALGNIDYLFQLAILEETRSGKKADDLGRVAAIWHFIVPMPFAGDLLQVRIMTKEFEDPAEGNRLYLIQAAEIVTSASLTGEASTPRDKREPHRPAGVEEIVARMADAVKKGPQRD